MPAHRGKTLAHPVVGAQPGRQLAIVQLADEWRLSPPIAAEVAHIFALLGDPTRVSVLHALATAGELRVSDLARALGRDASTISHQLRVLRDHYLVTWEKRGRVAVYRLADSHVLTLFQQALAHAAHQGTIPLPMAEAPGAREVV